MDTDEKHDGPGEKSATPTTTQHKTINKIVNQMLFDYMGTLESQEHWMNKTPDVRKKDRARIILNKHRTGHAS